MSIVVLVMIDGARPDAFDQASCPHWAALKARGTFTLEASAVMPSITLPCHTSIFHSVPPTRHGILTNGWSPMARPIPGLIDQASAAGLRCATFYSWEPLRDLSRPGSITFSYCLNTSESDLNSDQILAKDAARYLSHNATDFAFVYFGAVDTAGHRFGWMSEGYLAQLEGVDRALGMLLEALPAEATVLVQSDHGGHDRTHGTDSAEDMTIPWLVAGPDIRQGHQLEEKVTLLDTAPTLARLLGITPHFQWEGRCVEEIFV